MICHILDRAGLLDWLARFRTKPKKIFVVCGEEEISVEFGKAAHEKFLADTNLPMALEDVKL